MLPLTSLALAAGTAHAAPFVPPNTPVLLTRILHSPLADGKEVVARRTYELRISREGSGFRVEGRQIEAEVEAPESLRALAEIERNRTDTATVSFRLDAQGRIVPDPPKRAGEALDRAAEVAHREVDRRAAGTAERATAHGLVRHIQAAPALTSWPTDLFHPEPGNTTETRTIAAPGGIEGQVTIETRVITGGDANQQHVLQRTVVTQFGAHRRVTREEWTLRPLR